MSDSFFTGLHFVLHRSAFLGGLDSCMGRFSEYLFIYTRARRSIVLKTLAIRVKDENADVPLY